MDGPINMIFDVFSETIEVSKKYNFAIFLKR